jgi:hypothetical protein
MRRALRILLAGGAARFFSLARRRAYLVFAVLLGCFLPTGILTRARAEALPVYITARAADPALRLESLQVAAMARAALLDAQGFDWQTADMRVRGSQATARTAQKRALSALRRGRQAYLRLELDTAIVALQGALLEWAAAQAVLDSPEPVAETLMYLGACHVLSENPTRATEVFTRYHLQFAAVQPNSGLFNPAIMEQWAAAGAALRRRAAGAIEVRVRPASAVVTVDGLPRGTGTLHVPALLPGRHWLRVSGVGAAGSTREVQVDSGRVSVEDLGDLQDSAVLLDLFEHASSAKGAHALAQELGVRALGVIEVRRTAKPGELALELRSFEGESGREQAQLTRVISGDFVERSRLMRGLVAAWLDRVLSTEARKVAPAKAPRFAAVSDPAPVTNDSTSGSDAQRRASTDDGMKSDWYRRWWVWAIAGGAVAAGALTAALVVKSRDDSGTPAPSDKGTLILEF